MRKINLMSLIVAFVAMIFLACSEKQSPPTDAEGRPLIEKLGTIDCDLVETTPVVFQNKVYRFEYVRAGYWNNTTGNSYFRFVEHDTGKPTASLARGFHFGSAFVDGNKVYVTAVDEGNGERIFIFRSTDLQNWEQWMAFQLPGFGMFNTSLIKVENKFVLMFEVGKPESECGAAFTGRFATSADLKNWEILPVEYNYAMDRYTAPHCLRFLDGYYYDFYLEENHGWEMRVVRSKDLKNWEASPLNPVLKASDEDKKIFNKNLKDSLQNEIAAADNCNNSDIDFCEFKGKLVINYSWGNQTGEEFLAEAVYNGTMNQFLLGWFPN
jgi:alpha-L-fucosidase